MSFADVYANVSAQLTRQLGDAQAALQGPPVAEEIEPAGDAERVKAWNARNPEATDQAMVQLAIQQYQKHVAAGEEPEKAIRATAEDLTHFRYSQRLRIYTYGQVGHKEQVAEAKRVARLAKRETTPDPLPAPPRMPSAALTNVATAATPDALVPQPAPTAALPGPGMPAAAPTVPPELMAAPPTETPPPSSGGYGLG